MSFMKCGDLGTTVPSSVFCPVLVPLWDAQPHACRPGHRLLRALGGLCCFAVTAERTAPDLVDGNSGNTLLPVAPVGEPRGDSVGVRAPVRSRGHPAGAEEGRVQVPCPSRPERGGHLSFLPPFGPEASGGCLAFVISFLCEQPVGSLSQGRGPVSAPLFPLAGLL